MTEVRPRFEPVARRTVSEEVREAIAESIRNGEMPPGAQLPSERALCEEFGVARTSVREAIQGLIMLGMLEKRGNRSYVVEHLPDLHFDGGDRRKRTVRDLFEVRQLVEIPMARLATCRATDEQRAEIAELAGRFDESMALQEFRELDRLFHSALATASGNAILAELHGKVMDTLFRSGEFDELLGAESNRDVVREIIKGSIEAHLHIAEAIGERDWTSATEAAERHLDQVEDQMISRMV